MSGYIVYGDLNCPYSYALFERLKAMDLLDQVEFRLVEHAQDIGLYGNTADILSELASDVFAVRGHAPEVPISLPPERPDSRFANLCVLAAMQIDREKALNFIDLFYKALWVDGQDIASPTIIFDALQKAGLPTELSIDIDCEEQLDTWQDQWAASGVSSRVPSIVAEDKRTLIGLAAPEDLQAFFEGAATEIEYDSREFCKYTDHHTIAVFAPNGIETVWKTIDALRARYNILLPATLSDLKKQLLSQEQTPDLLLIDGSDEWLPTLLNCQNLVQKIHHGFIPTALINADNDDQQELQAYTHGASDFIVRGRAEGIIRARVGMMLELKRSRDFLERSARIDGLTGVNNRREFEKLLEMEWRRASRSNLPLSLIMVDVDHFKAFNDLYGHLAGDSGLRRIAGAMENAVNRSHDSVCRYGGEEFAVLLPETDKAGAELVAQRIRKQVQALSIKHERSSTGLVVTVSQGICTLTPSTKYSPHELVERADSALYNAKDTARNCIVVAA